MRTFDEIRELLAQKFSKEKLRLKSYGTKASSFDLANAVARHVQALMTESRLSELRRWKKVLHANPNKEIFYYWVERKRATKAMAQAIQNVADQNEKARPWKRKSEHKKKHHHHHG